MFDSLALSRLGAEAVDLMTPLLANSWKKHTHKQEINRIVGAKVCDLVVTEGTLAKFQTSCSSWVQSTHR